MDRSLHSVISALGTLWRDRRGVTAATVAFLTVPLLAIASLSVDVGTFMAAKSTLQENTNSAALAGAGVWSSTLDQSSATSTAQNWSKNNPVPNVTITGTPTVSFSCNTATSGLPSCSSSAPNVMKVTETGTVPAIFSRLLGFTTFTVSASATAAQAGGSTPPLNLMFIIDATGSMGQSDDTGCTVPNVKNPTKFQCAMYGVQLILTQLWLPTDYVGIMVFPGMGSGWAVSSSTCSKQPASVEYRSAGIIYQIWPSTGGASLVTGNTYNNGTTGPGSLIDTSAIVEAVGDATTKLTGCLTNKGGEGSYYSEALEQAQAALTAQGKSTNQNVIILLSDGEANATDTHGAFATKSAKCNSTGGSGDDMDPTHYYCTTYVDPTGAAQTFTYAQEQCFQGVEAAKHATKLNTWVYAIAYDSTTTTSSSACPTVNSVADPYNACTAMENIASDPAKFFTTSSSCTWSSSPNTYTDLTSVFKQVSNSLLKPRLVVQ